MIQVMKVPYFTSLVLDVNNGKGVNHNPLQLYGKFDNGNGINHSPLQLYGKFVVINKRRNFLLHSKIIQVEHNSSSPLGKETLDK